MNNLTNKVCKCSNNVIKAVFFKSTHYISDCIFGENHNMKHRAITGITVMSIGVGVAHSAELIPVAIIKLLVDGTGYGLHAIGLVPIIKYFENKAH